MMLPQYAKKYLSFHALRAYIMVNVPDHVEFTCEVKVDLFISVVRGRHFVVSMWTHVKADNVNEEETEDSTFSSNSVSLIGEGKLCQIRGIKERKGESFTIFSRKTKDPIGLGVDVGDSLSDLFDKACMVGCDLLWRSIGRRFHRFEEEIKKGEDVADIFSGVLVALDSPLPTDFGTSRDLMQCREKRDWHCEAAMFLPYVFSSSKDYFPDYLHELLGRDLVDVNTGHYFLGQRIILSLAEAAKLDGTTWTNLVTWTQMLCENAAIQVNALFGYNACLDNAIKGLSRRNGLGLMVRSQQWSKNIDLEEFHNISISKNPIFWKHLEYLKDTSGITKLESAVNRKFTAIIELTGHRERRVLAITAMVLTLVFGSIGFGRLILAVFAASKAGDNEIVQLMFAVVSIAVVFGILVIRVISRRF